MPAFLCAALMNLGGLPARVDRLNGFDALQAELEQNTGRGQVEGLAGAAKSLLLARVHQKRSRQVLIVTYQGEQATRILDDLRQFGIRGEQLFLLPSLESRWLADSVTDHLAL